jgi:hypothetical protein
VTVGDQAGDEMRSSIRSEAQRIEQQTETSALAQRRAAETWGWIYYLVGIPATVLAAFAGASALADYRVLAAVLALSSAVVSGLLTFLNPGAQASDHRKASARFRTIQNRAHLFADVSCSEDELPKLREEIRVLTEDWNVADEQSPHVVERIYRRAKRTVEQSRGDDGGREAAPRR